MPFVLIEDNIVTQKQVEETEGFLEASDDVTCGQIYADGQFTDPIAHGSVDGVVTERERRLGLGFTYDFGAQRGVHHIGTSPADMVGWDEVSKLAAALMATGAGSTEIDVVTNTGPTRVTALEWQGVLIASGTFRQPVWGASFLLQAMSPIPADLTNDQYWP